MTATEAQLCALVAGRLDVPAHLVPLDAALTSELGLDSLDAVGLVVAIEDAFAPISLADLDADQVRTLRDVASYIDRCRQREDHDGAR